MSSSFEVTTENHSHIIRSDRFEVAVTRSTTVDDLNLQGYLDSQTKEFVLLNL